MEKDVLSQVIDAEREIQKCLEAEKVNAREWLDQVKREAEEAFLLEQDRIRDRREQALAVAEQEAAQQTREIVNSAEAAAERLGQLNGEVLRRLVRQRISMILPG